MGGQLFAPQTRAKWTLDSHSFNETFKRGSFFPKGFLNAPNALRFALKTPFSISFKEYVCPPIMYETVLKN